MTEKPYFLQLGAERLFAFLHAPVSPSRGGVLFCAPLAEEKLWAHRVFVSYARELARRGHVVLRFDYRGEGDSDRSFENSCLETRIEDTSRAIEELGRHVPAGAGLTLIGLRLGASIAGLTASRRHDISRLVLWDPVTNGAEYMQSVLRSNLMLQMAQHHKVLEGREQLVQRLDRGEIVNVEGYGLNGPFFRQVSELRLTDLRPSPSVRSLIVSITAGDSAAREDQVALGAAWENSTVVNAVEEPFWREIRKFYQRAENLFRLTTAWLDDAA